MCSNKIILISQLLLKFKNKFYYQLKRCILHRWQNQSKHLDGRLVDALQETRSRISDVHRSGCCNCESSMFVFMFVYVFVLSSFCSLLVCLALFFFLPFFLMYTDRDVSIVSLLRLSFCSLFVSFFLSSISLLLVCLRVSSFLSDVHRLRCCNCKSSMFVFLFLVCLFIFSSCLLSVHCLYVCVFLSSYQVLTYSCDPNLYFSLYYACLFTYFFLSFFFLSFFFLFCLFL